MIGKYSPYYDRLNRGKHDDPFIGVEWKTGTLGYPVELAADGYDWYGYDENGRDMGGNTEEDYWMDEDLYNDSL